MTIKTPEQIARETVERIASIHATALSGENAATIAAAAIKADRAQLREVKAQAWREGWDASERFGYLDGVLETPLNPYLDPELEGPEPTSADERDYGKYLDQQFWGDRD